MDNNDLDVILDRRKKSDRRATQKPFEGDDRRRGDRREPARDDTAATKAPK